MKIYHTITCTKFDAQANAHRQFERHLTRTRRLTYAGVQRMFARGCNEYPADDGVCVTQIQTSVSANDRTW